MEKWERVLNEFLEEYRNNDEIIGTILGGGVLTLSTEHNSKNQKFYEKLGFEEKYVMEQYMK